MTDINRVPPALQEIPGWLLWKFVSKPGEVKPRKIPFYANGRQRAGQQGGEADRARLAPFDVACAAYLSGDWDGLGLAMLPEWGLVALDFDHCVDEAGEVVPQVMDAVSGTYSEFSPSGRGVRAFVRGAVADRKSHAGTEHAWGFETFHAKGFVTVTGRVLDVCELAGWDQTVAQLNGVIPDLFAQRFGERGAIMVPGGRELALTGPAPEGLSDEALRDLLAWLDPDCGYHEWLHAGMAVHHETRGTERGWALWDEWSERGVTYAGPESTRAKWESFGAQSGAPRTVGWLRAQAERSAAQRGQTALSGDDFAVVAPRARRGYGDSAGSDVEGGDSSPSDLPAVPDELPPFEREKSGAVKPTVGNAVMALRRPDLVGSRIAHDEFRDEVTVAHWRAPAGDGWRAMTDADLVRVRIAMEGLRFKSAPKELARDAAVLVAEENRYDSAQMWLAGIEQRGWDGRPRVERFLATYFGCIDRPYTRAVGRYIWTALAGRVLSPGCQADMAPVFEGDQGLRKTSAIAAMVPAPEFFVEIDFTKDEVEMARLMRGVLVGEISELRGLHTRDQESIKAFVSRRHEKWTPKYKEFATTFARRCILFGTTNRTDILADETGNRRWLPVHVERCDVEAIARDRDQLWAEGAALWRGKAAGGVGEGGVAWRDAEGLADAEHEHFMAEDAWFGPIAAWLNEDDAFRVADGATSVGEGRGRSPFTVAELMSGALGMVARDMGMLALKRVGAILKVMGYEREHTKHGKVWVKIAR